MFVYLFVVVVVVVVVFWLRPLRVVPVGRGSFTSGRPAVATATKHDEERVVARSTRFTSSEEADRATTFNPTTAWYTCTPGWGGMRMAGGEEGGRGGSFAKEGGWW